MRLKIFSLEKKKYQKAESMYDSALSFYDSPAFIQNHALLNTSQV
jgi:hypothetical protein